MYFVRKLSICDGASVPKSSVGTSPLDDRRGGAELAVIEGSWQGFRLTRRASRGSGALWNVSCVATMGEPSIRRGSRLLCCEPTDAWYAQLETEAADCSTYCACIPASYGASPYTRRQARLRMKAGACCATHCPSCAGRRLDAHRCAALHCKSNLELLPGSIIARKL